MPAPGELTLVAPRRAKPPRHLADLSAQARRDAVAELGQKPFRAGQLSPHYFIHHSDERGRLDGHPGRGAGPAGGGAVPAAADTRSATSTCDTGTTRKTLWRLFDGALVESVLMRYPDRITVCVSSQAGCGMNCPFCATGQAGLTRNMSTAEIVDQVVAARGRGPRRGRRRDRAASPTSCSWAWGSRWRTATPPRPRCRPPDRTATGRTGHLAALGHRLDRRAGARRSTKLTESGFGVTLAVSLHAPDDELRNTLVPINTRWPVAEVVDAAHEYFVRTGRRVSIEYAMIRDINDQAERADGAGSGAGQRRRQAGAAGCT